MFALQHSILPNQLEEEFVTLGKLIMAHFFHLKLFAALSSGMGIKASMAHFFLVIILNVLCPLCMSGEQAEGLKWLSALEFWTDDFNLSE